LHAFCIVCQAREIPGIKIFRFTSSLYYANAEYLTRRLYKKTGCNPGDLKRLQDRQKRRVEEAEKIRHAEEEKNRKINRKQNSKSEALDQNLEEKGLAVCILFCRFHVAAYSLWHFSL
jgi:AraC-like DNA-binding protein